MSKITGKIIHEVTGFSVEWTYKVKTNRVFMQFRDLGDRTFRSYTEKAASLIDAERIASEALDGIPADALH